MSDSSMNPLHATFLRQWVATETGIRISEDSNLLPLRLQPLLKRFACPGHAELIELLRRGRSDVRDAVIDAVTTNETSWLRDPMVYELLANEVLPELAARRGGAGLDLWSAACSSGQEPYSLAILLHEGARLGKLRSLEPARCKILGTDISPEVLALAREGRYDSLAISRGLSPELRDRYFRPEGRHHQVVPALRKCVEFRRMNLLQDSPGFACFDLVLLRNVLIYFDDQDKARIIEKAHRSLRPGGILVLGSSENAHRFTRLFEHASSGRVIYYRKAG